MTATPALTTDLQRQVLALEDDLRARVAADPEVGGRWKQEHQRALTKERTAASWFAWRDDRVTQAAVAWVLTSVFLRFCEDNALVRPVWIAGPDQRRQEALDAQLAYFRAHPEDTDREWLLSGIDYLARLPATRALVGPHSALRLVSPSGDAVTRLLEFWRRRGDDGALVHDLADKELSTRFLGDLYQDLSQHAKDTYALLQTPVFVEEFILDRTLEPALAERPLEGFKLIDPTCGSGHFLLGAFDRLLDRWHKRAPGLEVQARVQAALDAIHGVDLNPFAVAIARFRLTVAALKACGLASLEEAPAFTFHLAVGDSLIHGPDPGVFPTMTDRTAFMPFTYTTEDGPLLLKMLEEGTYDVVVGNPPYIQPKDKALNQIYRSKYAICRGKYVLTVPFMALFFSLARNGQRPGWVGQITSNSFMKREFGTYLIEQFFVKKDLRLVADTSGAFIPGHGTPTVIIVGRNQEPTETTVRAVLGIRGEPGRPAEPSKGIVWRSIVEHVDQAGWDDGWITVSDLDRALLAKHPWSLSGGGAVALVERISSKGILPLGSGSTEIGILAVMGEDDAFELPPFTTDPKIDLIGGRGIRDFTVNTSKVFWPYNINLDVDEAADYSHHIWPRRTTLQNCLMFGKTRRQRGLATSAYMLLSESKFNSPRLITFAEVATHNHFVFVEGRAVHNQKAPVIKLSGSSTRADYLALLGILNSSVACFWLKQKSHNRGEGGGARVDAGYAARGEPFRESYEFTGTTLKDYPIPKDLPRERGQMLGSLARELSHVTPRADVLSSLPTRVSLAEARERFSYIRKRMIAVQEELDWEAYRIYGLIDQDMTYQEADIPALELGERAFEIALARAVKSGGEQTTWFSHPEQRSTPLTEIPSHWPTRYVELVRRRLEMIDANPSIRLLERPEYKRRWASESWEGLQERAVRGWLLDRLGDRRFWFDSQGRPVPRSVAQLADEVSRDADMVSVLTLWEGRPDVPVTQSLVRLLAVEAVPYLAAYRYKDSGLRKREAWEQTWALQRREDSGERVGTIPVPPKYTSADFRKNSYWQARGKLDVPKERFILYPDAGRETDPTPLLGWAGWDHAQQSLALSLVIGDRERDGWADERLIPLVAGLAELQPWVDQWHSEVDPDYGVSLAAFCREQLTSRVAQVGKTLNELAAWRPAPATRGRRVRSTE